MSDEELTTEELEQARAHGFHGPRGYTGNALGLDPDYAPWQEELREFHGALNGARDHVREARQKYPKHSRQMALHKHNKDNNEPCLAPNHCPGCVASASDSAKGARGA